MLSSRDTIFKTAYDLARLDYFRLGADRRLRLSHPDLGPIIDFHTHLALAYGGPMRVDLHRSHDRTRHYLPMARRIDLDVYANKNFTPIDLDRMRKDLTLMSLTSRGMRSTHTLANLISEMSDLGIRHSVLLPIDFPVLSRNAKTYLEIASGRTEAISFGSVHPYYLGMEKQLQTQRAMGALGIKYHPAVQMVAPDDARAMRLFGLCGELGLMVLFHCGPVGIEPAPGRKRSQVRLYEPAIRKHPRTTFILGHSGALQMEQALALATAFPNVYLELASQSLGNIRTIIEKGPSDRILFGTDWPFYHQAMGLAKVFLATEDEPRLRRKVLFENAAGLLGLS